VAAMMTGTSFMVYFDPSKTCYETTGSRDVGFIWRPDELRHRDVNIAIWPATQNNVLIIREGDCSGNEVLCTFNGAWGYWRDTRLDDFYAAAEQYCIIIDGRGLDGGYGWYGDIGQLRIWDAATDEICDNDIDDDGSGTIDCNDWKCYGDPSCWAPAPCQENIDCYPHLWITTRNTEGNIWNYDGDNWRETDNFDPSCGLDGGNDGVFVWYADKTGNWTFNTFDSDYDTILWVRSAGTFGSIEEIACNNDAGGGQQSEVTIYAQKDEVFMIGVDANGPINVIGTNVEVDATFSPAAGGGCLGGLDGDWRFCQVLCPCTYLQGDCDTDLECGPGLVCADVYGLDSCVEDPASSHSVGVFTGKKLYRSQPQNDIYNINNFDSSRLISYEPVSNLQAPKRDENESIILAEEICQSSQCEGDFCNVECPCAEGEGDCDSDVECESGLECGQDNGPEWGCGQYTDICIDPANPDGPIQVTGGGCTGDSRCEGNFCTPDCPCLEGQGDCDDSDNDCIGELVCSQNVGADFGCASDVDICTVDLAISGGGCINAARCADNFCDPSCPCNEGYGNCFEDADCASGLVCAQNMGEDFGCNMNVNICLSTSSDGGGCQGGSHCDDGFCQVECPCLEGEGNCTKDEECASGLYCAFDVGDSHGCSSDVNVCVAGLRRCDDDYCSTSNQCPAGLGDCDGNYECQTGLVCLQDVGNDYGCDDNTIDICGVDHVTTGGGCVGGDECDLGYCDESCPCIEGQGQCDSNDDCHAPLICREDTYFESTCFSTSTVMACLPPLPSCTDDPDCDDQLFCNGAETCDSGTCVDGADPCPPGECNESTDSCESGGSGCTVISGAGTWSGSTVGESNDVDTHCHPNSSSNILTRCYISTTQTALRRSPATMMRMLFVPIIIP
jgi:hypothetical protein